MTKHYLTPPTLFDSRQYGFSQVIAVQGGTTVYIAGQVAWDETGAIVGPGDLREQVWKAFENVAEAAAAAGGTLADVVSMRIYVVADRMAESRVVREALLHFFPENLPTTTWIAVAALANEDFLVEVEPIAVVD
jgi:2-iminobutanoate/2-iminopropanoate deaminase